MKKIIVILIIAFFYNVVNAKNTIVVDTNMYNIDYNLKLILVNQNIGDINSLWEGYKVSVLLKNEEYIFKNDVEKLNIGVAYEVEDSNHESYILYFTELPIIEINTEAEIEKENRVLAHFKMSENNQNYTVSPIGISYRGATSFYYPKKSFRIEFLQDQIGGQTKDVSLLGMRSDDDWNLQAMYNEPLRFRSKTNNELWRKVYIPYYKFEEPDAINGVKMEYAELFLNGKYLGIYCVSERVDRKQLKLKKYNGNIKGELYKGVEWGIPTFRWLIEYENGNDIWGGFKYIYPDETIPLWDNLFDFAYLVVNEKNSIFYTTYKSKFDFDNSVDYFIFLNLLRIGDNVGKNIYIARYKTDEPYFYVPWDLDGSFGNGWTGGRDDYVYDLMSNGLYDRLWDDCSKDGFREKLKSRWNQLRTTLITHDDLMQMFQKNFEYLFINGVYERESITWPDYKLNMGDLDYISDWITRRLNYLDEKFNSVCDIVIKDTPVEIYPNPASDFLIFDISGSKSKFDVVIYNINGQIMLSSCIDNENNEIKLNNLVNGVYFVNVRNDRLNNFWKIIVQK